MTSILKVDTIQDIDGNNIINESSDTITIGASGDTITIPSGATTTLTDGVSGDFKMNSGFGSIATAYGCRAWVNFNGTGTVAINGSGNVSSITDQAIGKYSVNFTNSMPDINYMATQTNNWYGLGLLDNFATGSLRIVVYNNDFTETDTTVVTVAVFR